MLDNGTVLPYGLMEAQGHGARVAAFNQSYRNTSLKAGFVTASYAADDPNNKSQLCTEYDVQVIEQFENKGTTSILYKNCLSSQGFGSIADFLEFTLRPKTFQTSKGFPTFSDQDGAIVLIQCLDNCGDHAIVVGNLIHPDRPTTITSTAPQLAGEYNGVNIEIANDGSCSLTFNGATNSKGVSNGAGPTVFQIKADGSFQFMHSTIDILADKGGKLTVTTKSDCSITASAAVNITSTSDTVVNAGGKCEITSSGDTTVTAGGDCDVTASGKIAAKASVITLNGMSSGITTANSHLSVIDLITNVPVIPSPTVYGDI